MLVANSFDLWQRDSFFSAAEEVQQSADIMESAYRAWLREKKEGLRPQFWDDLTRELQIALGTAKWQLEEFEKAVRLSYRRNVDEITMTRHKQFVMAMQEKISHVEEALRESLHVDDCQPLRWVNLDENECDDLAQFLSGTTESLQSMNNGADKLGTNKSGSPQKSTRKDLNSSFENGAEVQKPNPDIFGSNKCAYYVDKVDVKGSFRTRDHTSCPQDIMLQVQNTRSSPDMVALEIVIDDRDGQRETLTPSIDATPKEKGFKPGFWRLKCEDLTRESGMHSVTQWKRIQWMKQLFGRVTRSKRQVLSHQTPFSCSIRLTLVFMLAIFLVVPFLIYSI